MPYTATIAQSSPALLALRQGDNTITLSPHELADILKHSRPCKSGRHFVGEGNRTPRGYCLLCDKEARARSAVRYSHCETTPAGPGKRGRRPTKHEGETADERHERMRTYNREYARKRRSK
jgi:hypothetical protein